MSHSQIVMKIHNKPGETQYIGLFEHHSLLFHFFSLEACELLDLLLRSGSTLMQQNFSLKCGHNQILPFTKTSQNSHNLLLLRKFSMTINPAHLLQNLPLACHFFYQLLNTVTYETLYINTNSSVTAIFLFTNDLAFS